MLKRWRRQILAGLLILVIIFVVLKFGFLQIKQVKVSGVNSCGSEEQLIQSSNILGRYFFMLDHQKISQKLLNDYPCLDQVKLTRYFPNTIQIDLLPKLGVMELIPFEEQPLPGLDNLVASPSTGTALFDWSIPAASTEGFLVDRFGSVFAKSQDASIPDIFYPKNDLSVGSKIDPVLAQRVSTILDKLKQFEMPIYYGKLGQNYLVLDSRPKLAFNLEDPSRSLASLQLILQKAKIDGKAMDTIDLRFNKPVVVYTPVKK